MREFLHSRFVPFIAAFGLGSFGTAILLRGWLGGVIVLIAAGFIGSVIIWGARRAESLRQRFRQQVHQPLQTAGGKSKALLALGAGSVSLVGLYALLGADSQAQTALANATDASPDGTLVLDSADIDRMATETMGVDDWTVSADAAMSEETAHLGEQEDTSHAGFLNAAIPAYLLFSGARSAWSTGNQYRQGSLSVKEGLLTVGADTATALARVIVVSSGARLAGMMVGGVPVIVLSGLAAGAAFEPVLRRMHAWLRGSQSELHERHIRNRLETLGRAFDRHRCLSTALYNLEKLRAQSETAKPLLTAPSWYSLWFPTLWTVMHEEYQGLEMREHHRLLEFFDLLQERLRDAVLRQDYGELGEIVYFNRQHLLTGLEKQLQTPTAAVDRALQQKGLRRRLSTADV